MYQITSARLSALQKHFIATETLKDQSLLYEGYPNVRGYSDPEANETRFAAVTTLAMALAFDHDHVLFLVPPAHKGWTMERFRIVRNAFFTRCKTMPGSQEGRVRLAETFRQNFKRFYIVERPLQLSKAPPAWVAFGFDAQDPVPEWLRSGLLSV